MPVDTSTPGFGTDNIAALAAGHMHTCALNRLGKVFCWGWNNSGQASAPGGIYEIRVPRLVEFPSE